MLLFDRLLNRSRFHRRIHLSSSSAKQPTITRIYRKRSNKADSSTATDTGTSATTTAAVNMADSTTATEMAADGISAAVDVGKLLSGEQLKALNNIDVGDLLFVVERAPEAEEADMSESEGDEDDDIDTGAGEGGYGEIEEEVTRAADEYNEDGEGKAADVNGDCGSHATPVSADVPKPPRMYMITAITSDEEDMITDVLVQQMAYSRVVNENKPHIYQIYGNEIVHHHPADKCNACKDTVSITAVLTDPSYIPSQFPQGDTVRRMDRSISFNSRHKCTSGCRDGWLTDRNDVNFLIANYDSPVLAWDGSLDDIPLEAAVCPVCVGREHLKEQERLQGILLTTGRVSMDLVLTHQGDLNARRNALGYHFRQFDERLWGISFDDMDDEEGEGQMDGGWDDPYEHFPEALDPNAYIKLNPASEATIQALPRKLFGETGSSAANCGVCMDRLTEYSAVIQLPCGHSEHHAECLELWLRQQETCTICRRVVPATKVALVAVVKPAFGQDEEVVGQIVENDPLEEGEAVISELENVDDFHPGYPLPGKDTAIAGSNAPGLLSSFSRVTEDGEFSMSD